MSPTEFSPSEFIVIILSAYFAAVHLFRWYRLTIAVIKADRNDFITAVFCLAPVFAAIINLFTLTTLASYDVVDSPFYITYYLIIGLSWFIASIYCMFAFFNLSWIDDALNMENPAAALAIAGGGLGATLIYAGSNTGDGPGWWCVFFAGGLGLFCWLLLGVLINSATKIFKQITVGRDFSCGIRTCAYFISSGIILGRASGGDWTSFSKTVVEFADGWPVLILTALFILIELAITNSNAQDSRRGYADKQVKYGLSLSLGAIYIAAAVCAVILLPPLPVNPIYRL